MFMIDMPKAVLLLCLSLFACDPVPLLLCAIFWSVFCECATYWPNSLVSFIVFLKLSMLICN